MGINLDETAIMLTGQSGVSPYLRAIRLFEFQTCLFWPNSLLAIKDTTIQKSARYLATLKLLEYLQQKICSANERGEICWNDVSKDRDYVEIFEKLILHAEGSHAIRNIWTEKQFDEQITIRKSEAHTAAKIVDFSYRFAMLRPNDKRKAGARLQAKLTPCRPRRRCGSSACPKCARAFQRAKVAAEETIIADLSKARPNRQLVFVTIVPRHMTYFPGQFSQIDVLKANRWLKDVLDRHGIRRVIIGSVDLGWEKRRGQKYLQLHWHLVMWTSNPKGLEDKLKAIFLKRPKIRTTS